MIILARIYDHDRPRGFSILVDRIWPRGLRHADTGLQVWLKEIAPGTALRKWFDHDPSKWHQFRLRYRQELSAKAHMLQYIKDIEQQEGTIVLLYGAKDDKYNNAVVLKEVLDAME